MRLSTGESFVGSCARLVDVVRLEAAPVDLRGSACPALGAGDLPEATLAPAGNEALRLPLLDDLEELAALGREVLAPGITHGGCSCELTSCRTGAKKYGRGKGGREALQTHP